MASNLFSIGTSGVKAARTALEVTAQNIANAATEGYVRRSISLTELASPASQTRLGDYSFSGVRVSGVSRAADQFRQVEVRRTSSDAARAGAELAGLENIESAVEQAGVHPALTAFEGSLQQLLADPTDLPLRAATLEDARTLARTFNIAQTSLATVGESLRFEAAAGVEEINLAASELARINQQVLRSAPGSADQAALLDQRDAMLLKLSEQAGVTTAIAADQTVEVRIGGTGGPLLAGTGVSGTLSMATAADGTVSFALDGAPVTLGSGAMAGKAQALVAVRDNLAQLDTIAASLIATANAAQAAGVGLDGLPGQPLFGGTGAGDIAVTLASGAGLATAPAGAGANSRDPANLVALRDALTSAGIADQVDAQLFAVSSAVAGRRTTAEALNGIASAARIAFEQQAGVDLDQEAANLVRYQQAFQACGKAIQVASDCFDTLLAIR